MSYWIAGIDVHKRMLAVVVADVSAEEAYQFERRTVGTSPDQLRALAEWLVEHEVEEVVMESTAQYWRPVWEALERAWQPRRQTGRAPARCRAPCIWLRPSRITGRVGGREISRMPNAW